MYSFEYYGEYREAQRAGWDSLQAFPEDTRYESDSLFTAFSSRLPDPKRRDIRDILSKYDMDAYDGYELLRRSTGRLPIDTYEFIDPIFPEDRTVVREFYVMGVRHSTDCRGEDCSLLPRVQLGDEVVLERATDNAFDAYAVAILTKSGEMLGYVPRYYSEGVATRLLNGMTYRCQVIEIDKGRGCDTCMKVRLEVPRAEESSRSQ
jgi:hypothetical protein